MLQRARLGRVVATVLAGMLLPAALHAAEDELGPPAAQPADILSREQLSGDWLGLREKLAQAGLTAKVDLVYDYSYNFTGGIRRGDASRSLFNFALQFDTEPLLNWKGGSFFLGFQNFSGRNGSESLTGDFQGFSNIDANDLTQISELWYQQKMLGEKVRLKVGKVDANSEFAVVNYGGEFLHSSAGNSPTILGMPTYPDPATSINLFVEPTEWFYAGVGVYDGSTQHGGFGRTGDRGPSTFFGEPSDLFLIGEAGLKWSLREGTLPGKLGVGVWRHTGDFERFAGGAAEGTDGFYAVVDQLVWRENPGEKEDAQGIGLFFQYGHADPDLSAVDHHIGLGAAWAGAIPGRDKDVLGLMGSYVHFSDARGANFVDEYELAIELFYKIQITRWFSVVTDLQYIINPGGEGRDDALVGTVRAQFSF